MTTAIAEQWKEGLEYSVEIRNLVAGTYDAQVDVLIPLYL